MPSRTTDTLVRIKGVKPALRLYAGPMFKGKRVKLCEEEVINEGEQEKNLVVNYRFGCAWYGRISKVFKVR